VRSRGSKDTPTAKIKRSSSTLKVIELMESKQEGMRGEVEKQRKRQHGDLHVPMYFPFSIQI